MQFKNHKLYALTTLGLVAALALTACGTDSTPSEEKAQNAASSRVVVVTSKSWKLSAESVEQLQRHVGAPVEFVNGENEGNLDAKLILRKDSPLGDVVVGLTANNIIPVAKAGVLDPVQITPLPAAEQYETPAAPGAWALDRSDVCANYDVEYFKTRGLQPPQDWKDLAKSEYKGLLVAEDPATSDTGLGMLLGTVQTFQPTGFLAYWQQLKANGAKFVPSWKVAYNQEFSQGKAKGQYPIVISYSSSPYWSVAKDGQSAPTANVPGTCYPFVDYGGILRGARNVEGAKRVLEWLRAPEGQKALMNDLVTYPLDPHVELDPKLAKFAPRPQNDKALPPSEVEAHRAQWIKQVQQVIGG